MAQAPRVLLEYPTSRSSLLLKAVASAAVALLYAFLAFNTREGLFNLGFVASFPTITAGLFVYRAASLSTMLRELAEKGEFRRERRGGSRELAYYYLLLLSPFALFLVLDRVLALGIVFGVAASLGFSDLIYYMYVRYREVELGGRLYAFLEPASRSGYYVWGLTLVK